MLRTVMPNPSKPLVAVIIVNWNGLKYLPACFDSLDQQDYPAMRVYLTDNGSSDDSIKYLQARSNPPTILASAVNLGFAEGNTLAIKRAIKDGAEYIFLLNNDTRCQANVISQLIDFMSTYPKAGIAMPKLALMDYPERLDSCGSAFTRTGFLEHIGCEELDGPEYSVPKLVFTVKGAAMLIKTEVINKIGYLDPDFFAYFEETDWCWRAWLAGYQSWYAPVATVFHKIGGSTGFIGSPTINYHSFKNHQMSQIKNLELANLLTILPVHLLAVIGFSVIYLLFGKWRNSLAVYRAIGWNIRHLSSNLKKRRSIQAKRQVSDQELFAQVLYPISWRYLIDFGGRFFKGKRKVDLIAAKQGSR